MNRPWKRDSNGTTLVCQSSAYYPRYRDDVLRFISMPTGSHLVLRYRECHVPPETIKLLESNEAIGARALLCYADTTSLAGSCRAVPLRFGNVVESSKEGEFLLLTVRLGKYVSCIDSNRADLEIQQSIHSPPQWENGQIKGFFLWKSDRDFADIGECGNNETWQQVVKRLFATSEFQNETTFVRLRRVLRASNKSPVKINNGTLQLRDGKEYELEFMHYAPNYQKGTEELVVESAPASLAPLGRRAISLDSSYNLELLRIRANGISEVTGGGISVYRERAGLRRFEFEIPVHISKSVFTRVLIMLGLTVVWVAQAILDQDSVVDGQYVLSSVLLGLVLSWLLVFGLNRASGLEK